MTLFIELHVTRESIVVIVLYGTGAKYLHFCFLVICVDIVHTIFSIISTELTFIQLSPMFFFSRYFSWLSKSIFVTRSLSQVSDVIKFYMHYCCFMKQCMSHFYIIISWSGTGWIGINRWKLKMAQSG